MFFPPAITVPTVGLLSTFVPAVYESPKKPFICFRRIHTTSISALQQQQTSPTFLTPSDRRRGDVGPESNLRMEGMRKKKPSMMTQCL